MEQYVITIAISIVTGVLGFILQHYIKENIELKKEKALREQQRESALETGVRQILSVLLEEIYDKYAESPTIPRRAYTRWMKMHDAYKGLHGNGTFDHMKAELAEKHVVNH